MLQLDGDMLCYECGHDDSSSFAQCTLNFETALTTRMAMAGSEYCNIHFTGADSGRLNTALVMPLHLSALREWVNGYYILSHEYAHAVYHNNQKASEGIAQCQHNAVQTGAINLSIIMSRDKDLLAMYTGLHCDWSTYEIKNASDSFWYLPRTLFSWFKVQGRWIISKAINCLMMLSVLVASLASWHYLKLRKRRATRAILYLQRIAYGATTQEANDIVLPLDASTLTGVEMETNTMLYDIYNGNQSAAIAHARHEGFRG